MGNFLMIAQQSESDKCPSDIAEIVSWTWSNCAITLRDNVVHNENNSDENIIG